MFAGFDIGTFGAAPTKFDAEDLFPLTQRYNQGLPFDTVAGRIAELGIPAEQAAAFWDAAKGNITVIGDLADWAALVRDGAEAVIEPEDAAFVAQAMTLLPPRPWGPTTWAEWTGAVKAATGRKGKGLFHPLRRAMTGREAGPDMGALMPLLPSPRIVG